MSHFVLNMANNVVLALNNNRTQQLGSYYKDCIHVTMLLNHAHFQPIQYASICIMYCQKSLQQNNSNYASISSIFLLYG